MSTTRRTGHTSDDTMQRAVHVVLQQALHDALNGDIAYDDAPSVAIDHARRVFEGAVCSFLCTRRSILQLPTELFVEALSYLEIKDQIAASHVSRRWRSISLATPHLWSSISSQTVKTHVLGVLAQLLGRTQDAPLRLDFVVNTGNVLNVSLCLEHHMHHVRDLYLQMEGELPPSLCGPLSRALEATAPILKYFSFWDSWESCLGTQPLSWFLGTAPLLRRLKLHTPVDLLLDNTGLQGATRLLYSATTIDIAHELPRVVELFPRLDTLALTVSGNSLLPFTLSLETLQRLSHLQRLAIIINGRSTTVDPIIPWLARLPTPHIVISWRRQSRLPHTVSETMAAMIANLSRVDSLSIHYSDGINLDFRDPTGVERTFLEVPRALRPGADIFEQVRSLSLSELAWTQGDPLPPAPALTELRVFLLRPYSHLPSTDGTHDGYGDASVFLLRERRALVCPALRRVALVVRCYNAYDPSDEPT
ncbi:hypothetical protein AURDEDRAFT_161436, partial [Auricularia subglabra TFB-10046 SS5]